jgi:hypothetical protein
VSLSCIKHADRGAAARCIGCGTLMCDECRHRVDNRNYCESCPPPRKLRKVKQPLLAGLLSAVPGLGQLYAGSPLHAIFAFGAACFLAANGDRMHLPEFLIPVAWFVNVCDAVALARRRNDEALASAKASQLPDPAVAYARATATPVAARRSSTPDRVFVGLTMAALGGLLLAKSTVAPMLSVALMWPVSAVLFGLTLAVSRAKP